jgi:hypothetical protein
MLASQVNAGHVHAVSQDAGEPKTSTTFTRIDNLDHTGKLLLFDDPSGTSFCILSTLLPVIPVHY